MKKKKIIPIIIALVVLAIIVPNCQKGDDNNTESTNSETTTSTVSKTEDSKETKNETQKIDISSQDYHDLVSSIFDNATENSEHFSNYQYITRSPYIQIKISPNQQYDDETFSIYVKEFIKGILTEFKKHEYKSGGIFKNNYEYINVEFLEVENEMFPTSRGTRAFIRIKPLDIQNATEEDISF